MSTTLARNAAISRSTVRQSLGWLRSTSSPISDSPWPPWSTSRASSTAITSSATPTTAGTAAGPTGPRWVKSVGIRDASIRTRAPSAANSTDTPSSERPRSRSARPRTSQPQLVEHVGHALVFGLEEGVGPAVLGQGVLPLLGVVHAGGQVDQGLLVPVAELGRGDPAAPVGELEVEALLLQGG